MPSTANEMCLRHGEELLEGVNRARMKTVVPALCRPFEHGCKRMTHDFVSGPIEPHLRLKRTQMI